MQGFHDLINWANGYLWGAPMLMLLFGTHLFLTFRLRFIQKYVWKAIKLSVSKDRSGEGDVSQFGALTTALAATIGTGNIVGVATAVGLGGPGAVLWCWLTGVFGMATKYAEALLSVRYRVKTSDGTMLGGPMYALENGLNMKWLAILFCIFTSIAAFGIGNMVQANSIATMLQETMDISPYVSGGILSVLTAVVILGGVKSIANVCEKLVPFMAIFYVIGCAIILMMNISYISPAISLIIQSAFTPQAAGGGFVGASVMMAMRYGIARGLFSNESGLGSAPIVAAAAKTKNPVRQALVSMTGTFWDTVVVCAMTGLVLVTSVLENPVGLDKLTGAALTKGAFAQIPVIGPIVLSVGLLTFVFSTILGWSYYGERAVEYLLGKKSIMPYRFAWVIAVFLGSVTSLTLVWDLADAMNALMAIPNLVSLIALSGVIVADTKKYLWEEGGLEREASQQYTKNISG
ncbi:alanine/glycine:cation symporter family protein [Sporomusa malonica]|uniref:Alanine or glycine:cation symporter, AGCS family n=1 Tax=Sporomusa malonica TaxID=112901 RepID=A0A1W2DDU0_9FIRM|nr:sodium:alanine symporter family protein [Sporomusa malonica]SMC95650.1 alanine or glycine:cation symporter, AGCS family [Sporomusa malonica]